jgi:hypothetical protein
MDRRGLLDDAIGLGLGRHWDAEQPYTIAFLQHGDRRVDRAPCGALSCEIGPQLSEVERLQLRHCSS